MARSLGARALGVARTCESTRRDLWEDARGRPVRRSGSRSVSGAARDLSHWKPEHLARLCGEPDAPLRTEWGDTVVYRAS